MVVGKANPRVNLPDKVSRATTTAPDECVYDGDAMEPVELKIDLEEAAQLRRRFGGVSVSLRPSAVRDDPQDHNRPDHRNERKQRQPRRQTSAPQNPPRWDHRYGDQHDPEKH